MSYNNPIPVAVAIIPFNNAPYILGIERAIPPALGKLALPEGYIDAGESVEYAISREIQEECSLIIAPQFWKLKCSRITPDNRLLLFCTTQSPDFLNLDYLSHMNQNLKPEVKRYVAITRDSLLGFSLHQEIVKNWFDLNS